jgi:hypothetical protein
MISQTTSPQVPPFEPRDCGREQVFLRIQKKNKGPTLPSRPSVCSGVDRSEKHPKERIQQRSFFLIFRFRMFRLAPGFRRLQTSSTGIRLRHSTFKNVVRVRGFATTSNDIFAPLDTFQRRHVGPDGHEVTKMLDALGYKSMEEFIADAVPPKIRIASDTVDNASIPAYSESELLKRARNLADANKPIRSYIGMGYWNAVVPPVILRNVRSLVTFHRQR